QSPSAFALADSRQWELVTPPDKLGARLEGIGDGQVTQAAVDGSAITYLTDSPTEAQPAGYANKNQELSVRGGSSWSSKDLSTPREEPTSLDDTQELRLFNEDLTVGALQQLGALLPLSPEATERTPYLRTNYGPEGFCSQSCYQPLVTASNVRPAGAKFDGAGKCPPAPQCGPAVIAGSADLAHLIIRSPAPLEVGANEEELYEWSAGKLESVSILPNGERAAFNSAPELGDNEESTQNVVSADGLRVAWYEHGSGSKHLYVRDVNRKETVMVDSVQGGSGTGAAEEAAFEAASSDGSRVFFQDAQSLTPGAVTAG